MKKTKRSTAKNNNKKTNTFLKKIEKKQTKQEKFGQMLHGLVE